LIQSLRDKGVEDPNQYIKFYSLQAHAVCPNGVPATETLYIHSKLMVVDDKYVICGSANINDRSMLGTRDQEMAVYINSNGQEKSQEVQFGSSKFMVSKAAHNLRTDLFMEHFGASYEEVADPISSFEFLGKRAKENSDALYKIFACEPSNQITNYEQLNKIRDHREKRSAEEKKILYNSHQGRLKGNAVEYPCDFLKEENLMLNFDFKELLAPEIMFV